MFLAFWRRSEIRAAAYLRKQGYRVVASTFRVREGEIDLIAWDAEVLVFIEVKSRRNTDPPEAAVGFRKRQRVMRAAQIYLSRNKLTEVPYRFDIVAINEIPGALPVCHLYRDVF